MEPALITGLINMGGLGAAVLILYKLHTTSLATFAKELQSERDRNDRNLTTLWAKMDSLAEAWAAAKCKMPTDSYRDRGHD